MTASIIITTYNYEKYIDDCIQSCLKQEHFDDYEIIIVNDGSTDDTENILNKYVDYSKIRIFNRSNKGIECSSNFGIKKALGKYVVRVDADDTINIDLLSVLVEKIEKNNVSFVYSDYTIINENGELINRMFLPVFSKQEILKRGDFLATGTLYKKEILERIGLYNENYKNCGLENYELIINLLNKNFEGLQVDKPLFCYRRHDKNISEVKKDIIIDYGKKLYHKFGLGKFMTNEFHPYELVVND